VREVTISGEQYIEGIVDMEVSRKDIGIKLQEALKKFQNLQVVAVTNVGAPFFGTDETGEFEDAIRCWDYDFQGKGGLDGLRARGLISDRVFGVVWEALEKAGLHQNIKVELLVHIKEEDSWPFDLDVSDAINSVGLITHNSVLCELYLDTVGLPGGTRMTPLQLILRIPTLDTVSLLGLFQKDAQARSADSGDFYFDLDTEEDDLKLFNETHFTLAVQALAYDFRTIKSTFLPPFSNMVDLRMARAAVGGAIVYEDGNWRLSDEKRILAQGDCLHY